MSTNSGVSPNVLLISGVFSSGSFGVIRVRVCCPTFSRTPNSATRLNVEAVTLRLCCNVLRSLSSTLSSVQFVHQRRVPALSRIVFCYDKEMSMFLGGCRQYVFHLGIGESVNRKVWPNGMLPSASAL